MLSPGSLVFATRARSGILASRWGLGVDRQIDRARTSTYQFHWHSQDGRGDSTGPNDCADLLVACGQSADGRGGAAKGGGSRRRSVWGIEARGERRDACMLIVLSELQQIQAEIQIARRAFTTVQSAYSPRFVKTRTRFPIADMYYAGHRNHRLDV